MRLDYTVIEEKGSIALIRRGETNSEYAVVEGLVAKENRIYNGTDWSSTIGYWNCSIQGLQNAIECFREKTETDYIPRHRLEELATLFKDGLIADDKENAMEYFNEVCTMSDEEKVFFGVNGMMTGVEFTIVTAYSKEKYFAMINAEESIEEQIRKLLSDMCFCDEYRIVEFHEVSEDYISERKKLIKKYEMLHGEGSIEYDLCHGRHVTLNGLKDVLKKGE